MQIEISGANLVAPIWVKSGRPLGFYEQALGAGDYQVCTGFGRCTTVTVPEKQLLRLDYEFSVGPGWSR